jgi:hypothetical protein
MDEVALSRLPLIKDNFQGIKNFVFTMSIMYVSTYENKKKLFNKADIEKNTLVCQLIISLFVCTSTRFVTQFYADIV